MFKTYVLMQRIGKKTISSAFFNTWVGGIKHDAVGNEFFNL
jgi:hypothetical protein